MMISIVPFHVERNWLFLRIAFSAPFRFLIPFPGIRAAFLPCLINCLEITNGQEANGCWANVLSEGGPKTFMVIWSTTQKGGRGIGGEHICVWQILRRFLSICADLWRQHCWLLMANVDKFVLMVNIMDVTPVALIYAAIHKYIFHSIYIYIKVLYNKTIKWYSIW